MALKNPGAYMAQEKARKKEKLEKRARDEKEAIAAGRFIITKDTEVLDINDYTAIVTLKTPGLPAQQMTSFMERYSLYDKEGPYYDEMRDKLAVFRKKKNEWDEPRMINDSINMDINTWQSKWGGSKNQWLGLRGYPPLTAEQIESIKKEGSDTYTNTFKTGGDKTTSDAAQAKAVAAVAGSQERQKADMAAYKKSGYKGGFSEWEQVGKPGASQVAKDEAGAKAYADAQKETLQDKSTPAVAGSNTVEKSTPNTEEKSNTTKTMPKTLIDTLSSGARKLVDLALQTDNTTNLSSKSFWNTAPDADRKAAWAALQKITGSAKEMADYVKGTGLQNLQSLSWWSNSPHKQQAWDLVQTAKTTPATTQAPTLTQEKTSTTDLGAPTQTTTGTGDTYLSAVQNGFVGSYTDWAGSGRPAGKVDATKVDPTKVDDTTKADGTKSDTTVNIGASNAEALKKAKEYLKANKGLMSDDELAMFDRILDGIDVSSGFDIKKVKAEFEKQKSETIDPEFRAQTDFFIDQLQTSIKFQEQDRAREIEAERALSGENIRQAKAGLEKAGMTFTGKGIEQLGAQSAYSQTDQIPFGGAYFEGKTQQANRLMSSGSLARYQKNLQTLGTQAEGTLGSGAATLQNIPGYKASGNITGALEEQRQRDLFSVGQKIATNEEKRAKAAQPIAQKVATNLNLN